MATRHTANTNYTVVRTDDTPALLVERRAYFKDVLRVAIDDISVLQEETEAYRDTALSIMAETLDEAGFRIVHNNDIDSIARVAKPVFIQRDSEKAVQENGAGFSEGFSEWNDALDEVTAEDVQRVTQIINERY